MLIAITGFNKGFTLQTSVINKSNIDYFYNQPAPCASLQDKIPPILEFNQLQIYYL
ncbi:MAG: hypothetical protein JJV97_02000 [SAR324 cluster bacterium]|nr:hypothetical protein [SAR324 cluster bacterium]